MVNKSMTPKEAAEWRGGMTFDELLDDFGDACVGLYMSIDHPIYAEVKEIRDAARQRVIDRINKNLRKTGE